MPKPANQVLINEYIPGQGIPSHVDSVESFDDTIAWISLGSTCILDFSHIESQCVRPQILERRSLLVISGEARYSWRHGIVARDFDIIDGKRQPRMRRLSVTFRAVRNG